MNYRAVNVREKLSAFDEQWTPKIVAQLDEYHVKLAKLEGEFVWHAHDDTDELFFVVEGEMVIHFRDGDVPVKAGELIVVPRGVEHKPSAEEECHVMLVELAGTVNTGESGAEMDSARGKTAPADVWV